MHKHTHKHKNTHKRRKCNAGHTTLRGPSQTAYDTHRAGVSKHSLSAARNDPRQCEGARGRGRKHASTVRVSRTTGGVSRATGRAIP